MHRPTQEELEDLFRKKEKRMIGDVIYSNGTMTTLCESLDEVADLIKEDIERRQADGIKVNGRAAIHSNLRELYPITWSEYCFACFGIPAQFINQSDEQVRRVYEDWRHKEDEKKEKITKTIEEIIIDFNENL